MPGLNHGALAVEPGVESFAEPKTAERIERGADAALTARAVVAVTFAGAGMWYVVWKFALYLIAGH